MTFFAFSKRKSTIFSAFLSPSYSTVLVLSSPKNKTVGNPSILYFCANSLCSSQFTAPILNTPLTDLASFSN